MPSILRSHTKNPIPSKYLSQFTKGRILGLHEPQIGPEQISHYLNIPPIAGRRTIAKGYQEGKENEGRGIHPKTTKLQDEAMVEEALKNHHTTDFEIVKKVALNVSTKTVKRRIAQKHLKKWVTKERVHLDEDQTQERLEWALAHRYWTRKM